MDSPFGRGGDGFLQFVRFGIADGTDRSSPEKKTKMEADPR